MIMQKMWMPCTEFQNSDLVATTTWKTGLMADGATIQPIVVTLRNLPKGATSVEFNATYKGFVCKERIKDMIDEKLDVLSAYGIGFMNHSFHNANAFFWYINKIEILVE